MEYISTFGVHLLTLAFLVYVIFERIKHRRAVRKIKRALSRLLRGMDIDQLINELSAESDAVPCAATTVATTDTTVGDQQADLKRQRLAAAISGGMFTLPRYKDGPLTVERLNKLSTQEVSSLYAVHEAQLGAAMTKTIGQTAIQFYAHAAQQALGTKRLPDKEVNPLINDLKTDPLIQLILSSECSELYYKYGKLLGLFSLFAHTANHCTFGIEATDQAQVSAEQSNAEQYPANSEQYPANTEQC